MYVFMYAVWEPNPLCAALLVHIVAWPQNPGLSTAAAAAHDWRRDGQTGRHQRRTSYSPLQVLTDWPTAWQFCYYYIIMKWHPARLIAVLGLGERDASSPRRWAAGSYSWKEWWMYWASPASSEPTGNTRVLLQVFTDDLQVLTSMIKTI